MSETSAPPTHSADPLAGDWSDGLPGPVRTHGIPPPRLLSHAMNGAIALASEAPGDTKGTSPAPQVEERHLAAPVLDARDLAFSDSLDTVEAPSAPPAVDSHSAAAAIDSHAAPPAAPAEAQPPPPASATPPAREETAAAPPPEVVAVPTSNAPPDDSATTPWSEPVADASAAAAGWDATAPSSASAAWSESANDASPAAVEAAPPEDTWAAAPPAEPVQEWQAEAAPSDFEEVRKHDATAPAEASAADWSSLRTGPDWTAGPASAESPPDAWGAAPPAPAEAVWSPAPAAPEPQWSAPAAPSAEEWSAPAAAAPEAPEEAPAPRPAPAWNAPAVGASALEQLESEPPEPEPGAANELFGSVPSGGMLAGDEEDLGLPEELASPEEVLRPVAIDHDDPDLPAKLGSPARTVKPRAQPLAALKPAAQGALEVHGEHRVAVHTRGGRTLRGTLRDADLSKSQFPLVPQGGGAPEAIYHAEVKAIFFMLPPGEKAHDGDGAKVRVTFADGRMIEGVRDGADAKHGFFLVPLDAARTNTRRIYVAREATSEIKEG
jgi:hypothetical protein